MTTRPTLIPSLEATQSDGDDVAQAIDTDTLDDVTGGCRRCGCGTQVAYSYQSGSGIDPQRLALAFAFSSVASSRK